MFGALAVALSRVAVRPRTLRFTSFVHHLDRVGWQAVPIIVLITFLIGCIISQQAIFHSSYGAEDYVVDLVVILVLREIGVLIVSIMVGRSGSSYTAELGSMKMREEIDALRTMGRDPVEILMLPRVLALVCAPPMLAHRQPRRARGADLSPGCMAAWPPRSSYPVQGSRLGDPLRGRRDQGPVHGARHRHRRVQRGLQVKGSAESLGLQTTTSVVKSIFMVIVLDGIFAMFFARSDVNGMTTDPGQPAIHIRDLVVGFGEKIVLDHLSLDVRRGEILGLRRRLRRRQVGSAPDHHRPHPEAPGPGRGARNARRGRQRRGAGDGEPLGRSVPARRAVLVPHGAPERAVPDARAPGRFGTAHPRGRHGQARNGRTDARGRGEGPGRVVRRHDQACGAGTGLGARSGDRVPGRADIGARSDCRRNSTP